jgi:hypothetical protein
MKRTDWARPGLHREYPVTMHSREMYCDLGAITVEIDVLNRVYMFYLEPYGIIYTCTVDQARQGEYAWRPGLEEAVDLLRTFI